MSDYTIQYGAQVAVQRTELEPKTKDRQHKIKERKQQDEATKHSLAVTDICKPLDAHKDSEIKIRQCTDEGVGTEVRGVIHLPNMVIVVDQANNKLKAFYRTGENSTKLKAITHGITRVSDNSFATCGLRNKVYLWVVDRKMQMKKLKSYKVEYAAYGLHYNGTYYCVLHHYENVIAILDGQGRKEKNISLTKAFGKDITLGWDIHMDKETHNIYVPCDRPGGVLCLTIDGHPLWFTDLKYPKGITEIDGMLCVAENSPERLQLISKEGESKQILLDGDGLDGIPFYLLFAENRKLYVSFQGSINYIQSSHLIFVFLVSEH